MNNQERLKQFCKDCQYKSIARTTRCPFEQKKYMCPDYAAFKASLVLEDDTTAQLVPVDLLLKALRAHGYTGELRKAITVTI